MKHKSRILLGGMFGNLVETFDLAICGLLSIYLAKYLVSGNSGGLFTIFLMYSIAYLARPLGAIVIGLLSDVYGRKIVLSCSILVMGIATASIGFIPSASLIGPSSIYILLGLRLLQSFSCGAEYLNASAYLVESVEVSHRGFSGSWASFGAMAGSLIASIMALVVSITVVKKPDLEWLIWRIPFVFALLGSSIGLYVRCCLPESFDYVMHYADHKKPTLKQVLVQALSYSREHYHQTIYIFLLSFLGVATTTQIYIYGPMQAHLLKHFSDQAIMGTNILSLIIILFCFPFMGRLSDKVKREKIIGSAMLGFLILLPLYFYSTSSKSYLLMLVSQSLLSIPAAAYYATVPVMMAEMFPLKLRCTVLSVIYSLAASLAAGLTPLFSLSLLRDSNYSASPVILIAVITSLLSVSFYFYNKHRTEPHLSTSQ